MINAGEDVEEREPSSTVSRNVSWYRHYGKWYGGLKKKKTTKNRVAIWPSNPIPEHILKKEEYSVLKLYMHPNVHSSIIYNS